jgi:5,10-methylenetetrahydrofolate reductase
MTLTFGEKIADPKRRVSVFEFIPPETDDSEEALARSAAGLARSLSGFGSDLDAIYIPQIVDESTGGIFISRPDRVEARRYATLVARDPNLHPETEMLITHPFPYTPMDEIETWLGETIHDLGIRNIVAVGPALQATNLSGLSATAALERLRRLSEGGPALTRGAIAMDTRRSDPSSGIADEPQRMVQKVLSGAQFFTTQLFYTPDLMIDLLQDYADESARQGVPPVRVFLSVAPIASKSTLRVVDALLGRPVENEVREDIFSDLTGRGNRSIASIETMLRRVFDHCYGNDLGVPLGVSVGHVTEGNFRFAHELLHSLPQLYRDYLPDPG